MPVTEAEVRAMLLPPQTKTVDRSAETLAKYRQSLPTREWEALSCWASTFYPYQRAWVFEPARRAIHLGSRQIGKSHESSGVGVLWGAFNGELTTIVSIGQLEANEVLSKAATHAYVLQQLGAQMARVTAESKQQLNFASGGRILALPSTGGRSFTGNLFLDELAYQEHAQEVWDSAMPTTIRSGLRSRIASTANGVGNLFHKLWTDKEQRQGYATHETTLQTAIDAGMRVDLFDCWSAVAKADKRLFDQIFNCRFLDTAFQYIPSVAITECSTDDLYTYEGEFYGGLDIGRTADLTALTIVRKCSDGVCRLVSGRTCKRTDQVELDNMVAFAFKRYHLRRLCVDSTGLGTFPAESMQKRYGRTRVEAVTFTQGSKEDLATGLYDYLTNTLILIPLTDAALDHGEPGFADALRQDIAAIKRIVTSAGNVRYDAPHTDDGHADRAWSLALALHAVGKPPSLKYVDTNR